MHKKEKKLVGNGQALVEFALVLSVFLILVLGTMDWGLYLFSRTVVDSAARDAVRYSVTLTDWGSNYDARLAEIKSQIQTNTAMLPAPDRTGIQGRVFMTFDPSVASPQTITVEIRNQPYTPISGFGPGVPHSMTVRATMRYENR